MLCEAPKSIDFADIPIAARKLARHAVDCFAGKLPRLGRPAFDKSAAGEV
jgi:hypothetical protein